MSTRRKDKKKRKKEDRASTFARGAQTTRADGGNVSRHDTRQPSTAPLPSLSLAAGKPRVLFSRPPCLTLDRSSCRSRRRRSSALTDHEAIGDQTSIPSAGPRSGVNRETNEKRRREGVTFLPLMKLSLFRRKRRRFERASVSEYSVSRGGLAAFCPARQCNYNKPPASAATGRIPPFSVRPAVSPFLSFVRLSLSPTSAVSEGLPSLPGLTCVSLAAGGAGGRAKGISGTLT